MKRILLLLALLFACPAWAQTNVPITQMTSGAPTQASDAVHVARCNYFGCDFQVPLGGTSTAGQILWNNGGLIAGLGIGTNLSITSGVLNATGGGGGSGISSQQIVSSGSSATAICGQFVGFNSASGVAKTVTIPTPAGSLCIIVISDLFGDAFTNNITPVPVSGTIFGSPSVYTAHGSITLLDTSAGWVSI